MRRRFRDLVREALGLPNRHAPAPGRSETPAGSAKWTDGGPFKLPDPLPPSPFRPREDV